MCKGVSIGENTVVGAGSVVASSLPANIIAAGNPAREIKKLDEATPLNKREAMFADRETYDKTMRYLHYLNHKENSYIGWLRELIWPSRQG